MPAPRSRQRRGPRPQRQTDRPGEPPLSRLRSQRRLAGALADRPRPDRLDPAARARRRAGRLRAQDAALPAAAYRRPAGLPRRRATLRLQRSWPWADALAAAFARLLALPPPAR